MLATALLHTSEHVLQVHATVATAAHCLVMAELVLPAATVATQEKSVTVVTAAQVSQVLQVLLAQPDPLRPLVATAATAAMARSAELVETAAH